MPMKSAATTNNILTRNTIFWREIVCTGEYIDRYLEILISSFRQSGHNYKVASLIKKFFWENYFLALEIKKVKKDLRTKIVKKRVKEAKFDFDSHIVGYSLSNTSGFAPILKGLCSKWSDGRTDIILLCIINIELHKNILLLLFPW